ncbi:MAG: DedA family protein [Arcobacteraceae bacterium]|nr:DedA family protein [Arcobacteraceae bacterium]
MNYLYLFFIALISATILPMGSEALLLYDISIDLNIYLLFLSATFGNSLGSLINYWLGLKGEEYLLNHNVIKEKHINKGKKYFDKYGGYSLLLSWVPIIGDPITFVAGMLQYNLKRFIILIIIAKGSRYLFLIISYKFFITS